MAMKEPIAKVVHYTDVPAEPQGGGASGVTLRWLIDEEHDGAPLYAMRLIEVEPGGHTPRHIHDFEHENFIVEGQGRLLIGEEWHDVGPGSVAFVPPGVEHTYENAGDGPFKFICSIPTTSMLKKGKG